MRFVPPPLAPQTAPAAPAGRRLWLHAGLHKTGTTSLQSFLTHHRAALAEHGLLYARAGTNIYLSGNHNVAWELTGDHRFELDTGTLDEAAQEIADFAGDAILSSEDFESLLHRPAGFDPLLRHPLLQQHEVILVVYVRNQAEYLISLLQENRKHGLSWTANDYLDRLMGDGRLYMRDWVFQFDLAPVAKAFPYRNARLIARNYHQLRGGSTIADFMALIAPDYVLPEETEERLNQAPARARLRDRDAATIMARFAPGNAALCAQWGLDPTGLLEAPEWDEDAEEMV